VAIESPLPQLDRLFDYEIPGELQVAAGCRVIVPFGKGQKDGFVVEITDKTEWAGKVSPLSEVVSPLSVLTKQTYDLVRAVADRQGTSFGDVITAAIPNRAVRAEKAWLANAEVETIHPLPVVEAPKLAKLAARIVEPRDGKWVDELLFSATAQLHLGKSAIIALPDFRDIDRLLLRAEKLGLSNLIIRYGQQGRTQAYDAFLQALHTKVGARIVVGPRSVLYAPVRAGAIYLWDDGDQSHQDQQSPYASSREIALIRQRQTDCELAFFSHSRSVEVQRLVEIGYLTESSSDFGKPTVSVSEGDFRVDSSAWLAIRDGLKTGPVLVQVSSVGMAKSLYCKTCAQRAMCRACNGPLWVNGKGETKCRWCNAFALGATCKQCGSAEFRNGKAGATRTVAEFGRSFPGTKVTEVTADLQKVSIDSKPQIVVSTPGIEPVCEGGYSAVIVLDAQDALARDTLKATEDAIRSWVNAIALMSHSGRAVIVGVLGELGTSVALWKLRELMSKEYAERISLNFPPAVRLLSATGSAENIELVRAALTSIDSAQVLGETPTESGEIRLLCRFTYSSGSKITDVVRELQLKMASGQKRYNAKSGRAQRPVTFKLDDPQVL
jgi:primosomal protein N' (replication factor Y)